jgi:hypothetical protein
VSVGSVLVGIAVALVVAACLARPFLVARARGDVDRSIETWVAQVRAVQMPGGGQVNCCPRCGRRTSPGDRLCAGCGAPLDEAPG